MTSYIYSLSDPQTKEVHYVGKTNFPKQRFSGHIQSAYHTKRASALWIKSLLDSGKYPVMSILEESDEEHWKDSERKWIAHYRSIGQADCNRNDGGEGVSHQSEETRKKLSKIKKNLYKNKEFSDKMMRSIKDPNRCKKISQALSGKKHSPEHVKKLPQNTKGHKMPEEVKKKISKSLMGNQFRKGKPITEEAKQKIREKLAGNQHTKGRVMPQWEKDQRSATLIGRKKTDEHKEKIRQAQIESWKRRKANGIKNVQQVQHETNPAIRTDSGEESSEK